MLPFANEQFFFGFRPIAVSPINLRGLLESAYPVLKSEALWVWMPLLVCSGLYQPGRFVVLRLYSVFLQEEFEDV